MIHTVRMEGEKARESDDCDVWSRCTYPGGSLPHWCPPDAGHWLECALGADIISTLNLTAKLFDSPNFHLLLLLFPLSAGYSYLMRQHQYPLACILLLLWLLDMLQVRHHTPIPFNGCIRKMTTIQKSSFPS